MSNFDEIKSSILRQGIINTHAHHLNDSEAKDMNLTRLFENSYVAWCGEPIPSSSHAVDPWLAKIENRSFYVSLSRSLRQLYSMEESLTGATWDEYNRRVVQAHENPRWHLEIMQNVCGYQTVVQDSYWSPGCNNGYPEFFKPAFRINYFLWGYNQQAGDHNGHNAQVMYGRHIDDIKTYTDFMYRAIKEKKESGACALKSAIAYDRTIEIRPATSAEAQSAMGLGTSEPSAESVRKFQDYIFDTICDIAAELKMPMQIHTGLGLMLGTNPMQLQPLIARHPKTTFVLMHGGYPWLDDLCGLVHYYPNVAVDLCWVPLISPSMAVRFLHELLEICNGDKIVWGCDTWTGEESWGALLTMADVLSTVLDEKVNAGKLSKSSALRLAEGIMRNNAKLWFALFPPSRQ